MFKMNSDRKAKQAQNDKKRATQMIKQIKAAQARNERKRVYCLAEIAEDMLLRKSVLANEEQALMDLVSGL
jgi:hypothetical protein